MEELSITTKVTFKDYCKFSIFSNRKFILIAFILAYFIDYYNVNKTLNDSETFTVFLTALVLTIPIFLIYVTAMHLLSVLRSYYIVKKDNYFNNEFTIKFNDECITEVTDKSSMTVAYKDIHKVISKKSFMVIYISPARVFIIPVDESNRETVGKILSLLREKKCKGLK